MRHRKAVIFDLDGVLVQTEPLKARAHSDTTKRFGSTVSSELYFKFVGQSHEVIRDSFMKSAGITISNEEYSKTFREIYHKYLLEQNIITTGAIELVEALKKNNYEVAVVSSTARSTFKKILKITGLGPYFNIFVSGDDISHNKPAPDPYLLALRFLKTSSRCAVAIEDSEAGLLSAHKAGLKVIFLSSIHSKDLKPSSADAIIQSLVPAENVLYVIRTIMLEKDM